MVCRCLVCGVQTLFGLQGFIHFLVLIEDIGTQRDC